MATRRRKHDRVYKDSVEDTPNKIAKMEMIKNQEGEDGSLSVDAYSTVMAPDSRPSQMFSVMKGCKNMEELEEMIQQRMQEKFNTKKDINGMRYYNENYCKPSEFESRINNWSWYDKI